MVIQYYRVIFVSQSQVAVKNFQKMTTAKTFISNKEIGIDYASAISAGYGHQKIIVTICFNGQINDFYATTSNMPAFDKANELEGTDKWLAYYEIIERQISDEIIGWIEEIES